MITPVRPELITDLTTPWLTAAEVGRLLRVHRSTVWRWLDRRLIPEPRRVGGRTWWSRRDLELFLRCSSMAEFRRLRHQRQPA